MQQGSMNFIQTSEFSVAKFHAQKFKLTGKLQI